jgi:hypothetical protein
MRFKYFSAAVSSKSFKNILCKDDIGRTYTTTYTVRVVCYGKGAGGGGWEGVSYIVNRQLTREEKRQQSIVSFFVLT